MILGAHSRAFYIGEGAKIRYLHDPAKPLQKRVCKLCGETCPVWTGFSWDGQSSLYHRIAEHTGFNLIVDSTKKPEWIDARTQDTANAGGRSILLFLTRDGRAVVNSRIRKYPERDPETQIRDWVAQIDRSAALFERFKGPKLVVRYEELAQDSDRIARSICDLAGLDYEPAMLRFGEAEHHVLGGNNGTQYIAAKSRFSDPADAFVQLNQRSRSYYERHSGAIELDLRWKTELSAENTALFDKIAGRFNQSMQWEA